MGIAGSIIIGVLTSALGFPIYDGVFHINNFIIVIALSALWNILYIAIKEK